MMRVDEGLWAGFIAIAVICLIVGGITAISTLWAFGYFFSLPYIMDGGNLYVLYDDNYYLVDQSITYRIGPTVTTMVRSATAEVGP